MAESNTLPKNSPLQPDEDYAFLRSEGLKYIEELGSAFWTDYNEHDPGITILEALCYAITELGYRAGLPVQDLLTGADGTIAADSQALFTAKNILTQAPLTINDYRKLLIDIEGVHNAWFFTDDFYTINGKTVPAGEVALYADCDADALSYKPTPHPVYLSGLYKVLLDLEDDLQFGDLNNGSLTVASPATASLPAGAANLSILLPAWNEADAVLLLADVTTLTTAAPTITPDGSSWKMAAAVSVLVNENPEDQLVDGKIVVDLQPDGHILTTTDIESFFTPAFTKQVLELYLYKIQKAKRVVQTAIKALHRNRNLCEDFISVATIQTEEIAICCDIDVLPNADMEAVQAKVFYAIEEYLNPTIRFYLLKELVEKGRTTDDIFEGPVLQHGFIDTGELEKTGLRSTIYASDIISLVMDIEGVTAIRNFRMTKYGSDGKPVATETGKSWCMSISPWHKPLLSDTKSKILFFKNGFPYLPGRAEVRDTLRWLRAMNGQNKLTGSTADLPVPVGMHYDLNQYSSIQYLFPQTYGIGKAGLPPNATPERVAQAAQLKGYLLLYDQLLADFFSQLKNGGRLFSTDAVVQTYFGQYLEDIKNVEPVYKKGSGTGPLLKTLLNNQDSTLATGAEWQQLYEPNATFIDRRNRFLDHLMARFAESFNDYVLLMYSLDYKTQQETKIEPATGIDNKIQFIKNYPKTSYERAKAFNYFPQAEAGFAVDPAQLWNTGNVSGLEKKVARLSGIENVYRRFLYCMQQAEIIQTENTPPRYKAVFKNDSSDVLTTPVAYTKQSDLLATLPALLEAAGAETHFHTEIAGPAWQVVLRDDGNNVLATSGDYTDEATATAARERLVTSFGKECDSEGLHLVEHILLRPRNSSFALAPVCLNKGCEFCGEQDPYSFRLSAVLPYWPPRFQNVAFRAYFEKLIRQEAPAHTTVKVCWVSNAALLSFETVYKQWIDALAAYTADGASPTPPTEGLLALQAANDMLTNLLFHLHSINPEATLHDCDESKDTAPVMLGKTILGSFKKV